MTDKPTDNGSNHVNMADILSEIKVPPIVVAPEVLHNAKAAVTKDIFAEKKRKAWKEGQTDEARCDFTRKVRLTRRGGVFFISLWEKSLFGRTLTDIKGDDSMVDFFAENISPLITDVFGEHLAEGDWAIITTPKRRHKVKNFASCISEKIAEHLGIPFYEDVALCPNRHRVGAIFTLNILPEEKNLIVFDDFVTTGSTLASMSNLLKQYDRNFVFVCGINNKL